MDETLPLIIDHGAIAGFERSPLWPAVEKKHLQKQPNCVACGEGVGRHAPLQVHHIFPFHFCIALGRPDLELDNRNLITLCEDEPGRPGQNHHLLIGHFDDYKSFNLEVVHNAQTTFHKLSAAAIKKDREWIRRMRMKPKHLVEMNEGEKQELKKEMDKRFPKK